ncbi:MAG: 16S rRNA (guanine(966)-N(2))-methyltransferase RsmD [Clostridia bacterium]|nr:16S rRNA (guanine(966)-N(2))-methyltransferase RsmD [Clostridia bacterium]
MRVISGSARGTKLFCPEGMDVRPTHDRVKEAVFSMLQNRLCGASVLDLFAGTGALGIEALSRGAKETVFVDRAESSLKLVRDNLEKTHLTEKATVTKSDYLSFLQNTNQQFDLIFLDPPYFEDFLEKALKLISEKKLLSPGGIIYCETEGEPPALAETLFYVERDKKYGRARVLLLSELKV